MDNRFMRVLVFFDLPSKTSEERKSHAAFRTHLIKDGFLMMQESVYSKLATNPTMAKKIILHIRKYQPKKGLIQVLVVTEKQFSRMELILGEMQTQIIESEDRLVIL